MDYPRRKSFSFFFHLSNQMKPSRIVNQIASRIAQIDKFEEVMIQIMFGPETDSNYAIKKAKEFIEREGFKTGEFFIEQQIGDLIFVGNMEISPGFIEKFPDGWEGGWDEEDEGIIVTMEVP